MKIIIIESPFAGRNHAHRALNEAYLAACQRAALYNSEIPLASHRSFTAALDDRIPEERELGIAAGLQLARAVADLSTIAGPGAPDDQARCIVFCIDLGWSGGMTKAAAFYREQGIPWFCRSIGDDWQRGLYRIKDHETNLPLGQVQS